MSVSTRAADRGYVVQAGGAGWVLCPSCYRKFALTNSHLTIDNPQADARDLVTRSCESCNVKLTVRNVQIPDLGL